MNHRVYADFIADFYHVSITWDFLDQALHDRSSVGYISSPCTELGDPGTERPGEQKCTEVQNPPCHEFTCHCGQTLLGGMISSRTTHKRSRCEI